MLSLDEYNHIWFKYDAKNGVFTLRNIEDWKTENFATHLANGRRFKLIGKNQTVTFSFYSSDLIYTSNVTPSHAIGHSIIYESTPFRSYRFLCKVKEVNGSYHKELKFEFIK